MTAANATVQMRLEESTELLLQFRCHEMANHDYSLLVYHYLLGQFLIQLTDCRVKDHDAPAGHGAIVQELCTYRHVTLAKTLTLLRHSKDPLQLARSWATPFNCEHPGGRIKLDNTPNDRMGTCQKCGCTDDDCSQCIAKTGEPCAWANEEHTLCSACVGS